MQGKGEGRKKILATFAALMMTLTLSVSAGAQISTLSTDIQTPGFYEDVLTKSESYDIFNGIASRNNTTLLAAYGAKEDVVDSWNGIFCFTQNQVLICLDAFELESENPSKGEMTVALVNRGATVSRSAAQRDAIERTPRIIEHVVVANETISSIADKYNLTTNTLLVCNGLTSKSVLSIGKKLYFPSVDGVVHTVKSGDSIWSIGKAYGISQSAIVSANGLEDASSLKVNQKLIIPGATKKLTTTTTSSKSTSSTSSSSKSVKGITFISPVKATITSKFGSRWGTTHKGLDFGVSVGTSVKAAAAGTVTYSGVMSGYGNIVILDHGNGVTTYYAHNSVLLVKVGQKVQQGQVITKSGNTGRTTGPHLHFEIRINGSAVNPLNYL